MGSINETSEDSLNLEINLFDERLIDEFLKLLIEKCNNNDGSINDNNISNIPSPTQNNGSPMLPLPLYETSSYETSSTSYETSSASFESSTSYENISDDESSLINCSGVHLNIQNYPSDIENWDHTHIMKWILELYDKKNYRYEDLNIHFFRNKTGSCLKGLDKSFWKKIDSRRGSWLFDEVQCLLENLKYKSDSLSDCGSQPLDEPTQTTLPRKRGRPPKSTSKPRNKEKVGRIWEFLRDLLKDTEYCPQYIRWDNYDNLEFRLVDPRKICEIWGQKKGKDISYEHFSRSIRHYYKLDKDDPESNKAKILSVPDRRLVYKFNKDALEPEDFKQFLKCIENNL